MKPSLISTLTALGLLISSAPAQADSCAELWYKRNVIFAQNGYCFKTPLGKRTFRRFDCWTNNPTLTASERRRVAAIRKKERKRGCKVN